MVKKISVNELYEIFKRNEDVACIDVRFPSEFRSESIYQFKNIPLDKIDHSLESFPTDKPIYISCRSGKRSLEACKKLLNYNLNVINVDGGILEWKKSGLPVVSSKVQVISIMRQVQIVVGVGVLTGVFLAYFLNINFIWLAGFFGAGMLFAGISNTCGMGMLLGKMPWNN